MECSHLLTHWPAPAHASGLCTTSAACHFQHLPEGPNSVTQATRAADVRLTTDAKQKTARITDGLITAVTTAQKKEQKWFVPMPTTISAR